MGKSAENLRNYIVGHKKFWDWPPDVEHKVIYLGAEQTTFKNQSCPSADVIRYHFQLDDGRKLAYDVKSLAFAGKMAVFNEGDCIRIKRITIGLKKYDYNVSLIE
jgi:hypothetical protein